MCSDQEAVDLIRTVQDPFAAAKILVDHALNRFSTDNLSCMVVRLDRAALADRRTSRESVGTVDGASSANKSSLAAAATPASAKQTEVEKIVGEAKRKLEQDKSLLLAPSSTAAGRSNSSSGSSGSCAIVEEEEEVNEHAIEDDVAESQLGEEGHTHEESVGKETQDGNKGNATRDATNI